MAHRKNLGVKIIWEGSGALHRANQKKRAVHPSPRGRSRDAATDSATVRSLRALETSQPGPTTVQRDKITKTKQRGCLPWDLELTDARGVSSDLSYNGLIVFIRYVNELNKSQRSLFLQVNKAFFIKTLNDDRQDIPIPVT